MTFGFGSLAALTDPPKSTPIKEDKPIDTKKDGYVSSNQNNQELDKPMDVNDIFGVGIRENKEHHSENIDDEGNLTRYVIPSSEYKVKLKPV